MTALQKIFLLIAVGYVMFKVVMGIIIYIITLKVEEKETLLRARRIKNMELYRRQYLQLEERKKDLAAME